MKKNHVRLNKRFFATVFFTVGCVFLAAMAEILFDPDSREDKIALLLFLPVPAAFLIASFVLFRIIQKEEAQAKERNAPKQETEPSPQIMQTKETVDWKDDSSEIHTVTSHYHITEEDGWQKNYSHIPSADEPQAVKGTQIGIQYETDDYRKVLAGYIIASLFFPLISVFLLIIVPVVGIPFAVISVIGIVSMWKNAPYKKWKNQAKKRKEKKDRDNS